VSDVILEFEALRRAHAELQLEHAAVVEHRNKLEQENNLLRAALKAARHRLFGRRSEKLDGIQHELFEESKTEIEESARQQLAETAAAEAEQAARDRHEKKRAKRRRRPLDLANLPRERVVHEASEAERTCSCCQGLMEPFDEEVTSRLEYVPAVLRVVDDVKLKYACPRCHEGVVTAEGPERPIPRIMAGASLLAHLATSKFAYHLPLYRQEQIFASQGIEISRKTMCMWLGAVAELLAPIVEEMKRELLELPLIQSDDTTIRYQDHSRRGQTACGYLWAYSKPWEEVVFDFRTDRSRAGPVEFLAGYQGAVQADGYAGYNELFRRDGVVHVGCMAHVRRKIYESRDEHPQWAELLLAGIQRVYRIERHARADGITGERLLELRAGEPHRVLTVLGNTITDLRGDVLPKSGFGKALAYAHGLWPSIMRYTEIAEAELDNNGVENAIRPVALGRRNWLFAGSESGGQRAAILFSLVTTCKRLGIDPQVYLADVIARAGAQKLSRIGELTPRHWKAARA
jgi:transposase